MNDTENGNKTKQKQLLIEVADASDGPLVSSFPGGLPSTEAKFVWKKYNQRHILVGKDDSCRYYGQEEPSRSRLVIALYDKRNHTLTCHMAANEGQVYALQQQVINYETNITADPTSNVFQEFGSSKKKRALQSQQANRIHSDQILGKAGTLTKMVVDNKNLAESNRKAIQEQKERNQNTEVNDPAPAVSLAVQEATNAWRSAFLPNHANPNADTPTKVYTPENMAGPEAWSQVIRVVDACFHEEDPAAALQKSKSSDTWQFSSLRELLLNSKPQKGIYRALCLLHTWTRLYEENHRKRFVGHTSSNAVVQSFWQNFGTSMMSAAEQKEGYCMSKANQDRCKLHLLLLFLWVEGCSTSKLPAYCAEMKWPWAQMVNLLQEAGCTIQKDKVSLNTPVQYPQSIGKRKRK
jgi:hypothetical protein